MNGTSVRVEIQHDGSVHQGTCTASGGTCKVSGGTVTLALCTLALNVVQVICVVQLIFMICRSQVVWS